MNGYYRFQKMVSLIMVLNKKIDFSLKQNFQILIDKMKDYDRSFVETLDLTEAEDLIVRKFWNLDETGKWHLPETSEEKALLDWAEYNGIECQEDLDPRVLDLKPDVEKDLMRVYHSKRRGQCNSFRNIKFYLDHVNEAGLGRSTWFWSFIDERHSDVLESIKEAKIITSLGLVRDSDYVNYDFLVELCLRNNFVWRYAKDRDLMEKSFYKIKWNVSIIKKVLDYEKKTFRHYDDFIKYIDKEIEETAILYDRCKLKYSTGFENCDDDDFFEYEPFVLANYNKFKEYKEGKDASEIDWIFSKENNLEETMAFFFGKRFSIESDVLKDVKRNILTKKGYLREMNKFPEGVIKDVLEGKLGQMVKEMASGLKITKAEALKYIQKGKAYPSNWLYGEPLSWCVKEDKNTSWSFVKWWFDKKDLAFWEREQVVYGPEGQVFRFKYRSLIDEIRPDDLINGDKTSPEKVIEHACQRRQTQVEGLLGCDWTPLPKCPLQGNDIFKQLKTPAELVQAGKYFHNCVAGYVRSCQESRCYIFTSRTICSEIYFDSEADTWRVRQCLSFHNSSPSDADRSRFDSWLGHAILTWRQNRDKLKNKKLLAA